MFHNSKTAYLEKQESNQRKISNIAFLSWILILCGWPILFRQYLKDLDSLYPLHTNIGLYKTFFNDV